MKKQFVTVFALLSMMAVSCHKENFTEFEPTVVGESAVYTLSYAIDGVSQHAQFDSNISCRRLCQSYSYSPKYK
jgi:hypothetical protein